MTEPTTPCHCNAYQFPHRPGSGDCNGEPDCAYTPTCRECGAHTFTFYAGCKGARDGPGGPPLEPDEPAGWTCTFCGSEEIAESREAWGMNWEGPIEPEPPGPDPDWDHGDGCC